MKWWLRVVGCVYLAMFVLAGVARVPIRVLAPSGTLEQARAGEPVAQLLVDTWLTLGLEYLAISIVLVAASRFAERAHPLIWAVLALEVVRGIGTDVYMLACGYATGPHIVWIFIHMTIVATGSGMLRNRVAGHSHPVLVEGR